MTSEERKAARIALARSRAERARLALVGTMGDVQARLHPRALLREAAGQLRQQGIEAAEDAVAAARARPGLTVAIAGAIGLIAARRPIARSVMNLFSADEEPAADQEGWNGDGQQEKKA
jgi:ElaB/YqjD/DUF883 family membrane-anchored ribosome-binding protein